MLKFPKVVRPVEVSAFPPHDCCEVQQPEITDEYCHTAEKPGKLLLSHETILKQLRRQALVHPQDLDQD
jgi:hypothetical protein